MLLLLVIRVYKEATSSLLIDREATMYITVCKNETTKELSHTAGVNLARSNYVLKQKN